MAPAPMARLCGARRCRAAVGLWALLIGLVGALLPGAWAQAQSVGLTAAPRAGADRAERLISEGSALVMEWGYTRLPELTTGGAGGATTRYGAMGLWNLGVGIRIRF